MFEEFDKLDPVEEMHLKAYENRVHIFFTMAVAFSIAALIAVLCLIEHAIAG